LSARTGMPEEAANIAPTPASDEARFINATNLLIDGVRPQLHRE